MTNLLQYFSYPSIRVLFSVIGIAAVVLWLRRNRHLPPGPVGLPVVGYLPFLGKEAYRTLDDLGKVYGPVFSLYLGRRYVVVLNRFDVVKQALSNNNILDRPKNPPNHLLPNTTNLSVSNGQTWKEQRQFTMQALRHLGMGKSKMEDMIQEELGRLTKAIDAHRGNAMNLNEILVASVSNNIVTLLTGRALEYDDADRIFLNNMIATMTLYFRPTRVHAYFPWLRPFMTRFKIWGYDGVHAYMTKLNEYIERQIEMHEMASDAGDDYIGMYLRAMSDGPKSASFTRAMLKGNVQSLLGAGSTPARATVEWALITMIRHPAVQKRVQEELDSVVGRDRLPSWSDSKAMPYVMAVIYEVMRYCSIIPIGMLRCTTSRCKIGDYVIPKDTLVMTNLWGVHRDPAYWRDPESFDPERFLERGELVRPPAFIPLSYGKRNCPGEDMAYMVVFLYFASLMQRYDVTAPSSADDFRHVLGIANQIISNNVCLKLRS